MVTSGSVCMIQSDVAIYNFVTVSCVAQAGFGRTVQQDSPLSPFQGLGSRHHHYAWL